ncbi:MAG: helix-turn-helix domain-containing protein [Streptomyces sp.]|nr:helix-turn-helix domain-containing protein [Streptomyces sp.]NUS11698.1 helix-turn-helix domain-containing protein [Streptomyces sp.]NUS28186.1 helix-turn-helix domain-containing protein [Streptomyces sp.]NUS75093.1 helix-turn-helix domain-containing protein [Streptomyces sp.]
MADTTSSGTAAGRPTEHPGGDLGRRLIQRRRELGLTRADTADRAGVSSSYLRYLEESSTAAPGRSVLLRLAGALGTSAHVLTGGAAEAPPGRGQAARSARSAALSGEECRRRLGTHGVGRLALTTADGPTVLPVNYSVVDGVVAFRTAPGTVPSEAVGRRIAFEVDHIDEAASRGWSVLVRGLARRAEDPVAVRRLTRQAYSAPWAGGRRDLWVWVDADEITGREIRQAPGPDS